MTNFKKILITTCAIFTTLNFVACKTGSKISSKPVEVGKKFSAQDYIQNQIDFKSFTGKASVSIQNKGENQNLTTNLKMRKDKDIWSSVMALGGLVEVARAYITPDSLQAMVRIGKKAYRMSYQEGLQLIQADIEFSALQNLFIGNPLISNGKIVQSEEKDGLMIITMEKDGYQQTATYELATHLLKRLNLISKEKNFSCEINFSNYKALALQVPFSFFREILLMNKGEQVKIEMTFDKADINTPVEIQFSIPDSYTPGKI